MSLDPRAFSSEVDTGSREENASNQEARVLHRFYETAKDSKSSRESGILSLGGCACPVANDEMLGEGAASHVDVPGIALD